MIPKSEPWPSAYIVRWQMTSMGQMEQLFDPTRRQHLTCRVLFIYSVISTRTLHFNWQATIGGASLADFVRTFAAGRVIVKVYRRADRLDVSENLRCSTETSGTGSVHVVRFEECASSVKSGPGEICVGRKPVRPPLSSLAPGARAVLGREQSRCVECSTAAELVLANTQLVQGLQRA